MSNILKNLIYIILFSILIIVLFARSIQYVYRIYKEFKYPVEKYYPEIIACSNNLNLDTYEKKFLYRYRSMGIKCEN